MTRANPHAAARLIAALLLVTGVGVARVGAPAANAAPKLAPPADPGIARIYENTCRTCHGNPASGAPLAGDKAAWAASVAQGRDTILDHAINGFRRMPPMGLCSQCSESDFTALIEYMTGAKLN